MYEITVKNFCDVTGRTEFLSSTDIHFFRKLYVTTGHLTTGHVSLVIVDLVARLTFSAFDPKTYQYVTTRQCGYR